MGADGTPVIGFVGRSGSGKTTLLKRLVPILSAGGLRVGYLKHAHHTFDLDKPGKDSFEIRNAGAAQTLLASRERWALQVENAVKGVDPDLQEMLGRFESDSLDMVVVEGFKNARLPKIEVYRAACAEAPLFPADEDIVAIVTDDPLPGDGSPPVLSPDDVDGIAEFVLKQLALSA